MNTFTKLFESPLFEASLSRILSHWGKKEFVVISASRRENTAEENAQAKVSLKKDLKDAGYGYVPVEGVGQEQDEQGNIIPVEEESFLVPNPDNREGFLQAMLALSSKYGQWGIAWARGDGTGALVTSDGTEDTQFSNMHAGIAKFFTRLIKSKSSKRSTEFYLESLSKASAASGLLEQQSRSLKGELFSFEGPLQRKTV